MPVTTALGKPSARYSGGIHQMGRRLGEGMGQAKQIVKLGHLNQTIALFKQ
jgi:hypothetical protein